MANSKEIVILVQLGSPKAPTPEAVKAYLAEFLGDDRVIDLPKIPKALLLHGIILRKRPAKVAPKYAQIWTEQGSPLVVWSQKQAEMLQAELGDVFDVRLAMRYGANSLKSCT